MRKSSQFLWTTLVATALIAWPVIIAAQSPSSSPPSQTQTQSQPGQSQDPNAKPSNQQDQTQTPDNSQQARPIPLSQQAPPPPPQDPNPKPAAGSTQAPSSDSSTDQPSKTVHPKNSKEDVDAIGNRNVGKGVNFFSIEREIALGKSLAQEVERSSKMIDDPVVTEYVNRVGQNLVRNSDAQVPFTIKVIDSDEVNAFALPGGFFYVNSGLILRA